jgi:uncharacterized small protein (DUF1192 family)
MDDDDLTPPKKTSGLLAELIMQDLDRMSRDEVEARITTLESELARCRARLADASAVFTAAERLFKS